MAIRVLIVDDSGFFRRRLNEMLNSDPMIEVVDMAVDGKDAIAKVKQCKPDVVTMDIEMPVMNGIDATTMIKTQKLTDAPVIGMTASVMNDEIENYYEAGMDALVEKPINFEQLMAVVSEQLKSSSSG